MGNLELFNQIADSYNTPERIRLADVIAGALRSRLSELRTRRPSTTAAAPGL